MKVRTGFVSNSSSSSFVIRFKTLYSEDSINFEHEEDPKVFAERSSVKKLKKFGFKWVKQDDPLRIELATIPFESFVLSDADLRNEYAESVKREKALVKKYNWARPLCYNASFAKYEKHMKNTLAFNVAYNEDEVLVFLLKNNIPFTAATHYGHWVYIYKKDSPYMICLPVYASRILMYGDYEEVEKSFSKSLKRYIGPKAEKIYVKEYIKEIEEEYSHEY